MGFNVQGRWGSSKGSVNGGKVVIVDNHLVATLPVGAVVSNPPAVGGMIFEGDVAEFNFSTKTCKHLKVFELAEALTAESTTVKIKRGDFRHKLEAGLKLIPAPDALTDTATGITVGAVTVTTDSTLGDLYTFSITAEDFGELPAGSLFVEADKDGAGAVMLVSNPNSIFVTDIYIDATPATGSTDYEGARYPAALYNVATIYGVNATKMPDCVKENLRKGYSDIKVLE